MGRDFGERCRLCKNGNDEDAINKTRPRSKKERRNTNYHVTEKMIFPVMSCLPACCVLSFLFGPEAEIEIIWDIASVSLGNDDGWLAEFTDKIRCTSLFVFWSCKFVVFLFGVMPSAYLSTYLVSGKGWFRRKWGKDKVILFYCALCYKYITKSRSIAIYSGFYRILNGLQICYLFEFWNWITN